MRIYFRSSLIFLFLSFSAGCITNVFRCRGAQLQSYDMVQTVKKPKERILDSFNGGITSISSFMCRILSEISEQDII